MKAQRRLVYSLGICTALSATACDKAEPVFGDQGPAPLADLAGSGAFQFEPVATSAACTAGGNAAEPLILPAGYAQTVVAGEPDYPDLPDMNTVNETGASAGRFLYRAHEIGSNGAVTVTDWRPG